MALTTPNRKSIDRKPMIESFLYFGVSNNISTPRKVEDSWIPQLQSSADRAAEVRSDIVEANIFDLHSFARWGFGHQVCTDRTVDCEERWLQR
jgi:hypothetical protein